MKKLILIIALGALNAFAIDCLRATFEIFDKDYPTSSEPTTTIYKNFFVDSIYFQNADTEHGTEYETNKVYYTGSHVDSAKTYTKKKDSDDWKIKVQSRDSLSFGKITITQDGDFKTVIQEGNGNPPIIEHSIYEVTEDSVIYTKSYIDKNGEVGDSYFFNYFIKNDTLFQFEDGKISMVLRDTENESKCYEYKNLSTRQSDILVSYEYEMRGDTLTATRKNHGDNQSSLTIFFVPSEKYSSTVSNTIISAKRRPKLNPAKSKDFDLLGRPAQNQHIFIIKR